jgi:tripartite-type tricarboxylate transporter receptor subunit TctC
VKNHGFKGMAGVCTPTGGEGADEFSAYIKSELQRWGQVIKDGNIKAE